MRTEAKLVREDQKKVIEKCDETITWLENNQLADKRVPTQAEELERVEMKYDSSLPPPVVPGAAGHDSLIKIQRFLTAAAVGDRPTLHPSTSQLSRERGDIARRTGSRQGIAIFIFSNNNNLYENDCSVVKEK
ncbi:heat shock 70 kDa protein 1-like protein [Lates japonicus]|uniref:Heat shock 70 kDa protein 1-like protein n=1 Tax=Lates japonicus TaxID=270547 RepID=A0AAD3M7C5_LATJO|nr:heat shock 70 kDa protein 1-like protein [Lates japonicus]